MNTLTLILTMICIMFVNALGAFYFKKASKKFKPKWKNLEKLNNWDFISITLCNEVDNFNTKK